jgi:hypothetical protein
MGTQSLAGLVQQIPKLSITHCIQLRTGVSCCLFTLGGTTWWSDGMFVWVDSWEGSRGA